MDCAEFIEKYFNIKLLPYQKKLVEMTAKGNTYVCYPLRTGYSDYLILREMMKIIYGGLEDGRKKI